MSFRALLTDAAQLGHVVIGAVRHRRASAIPTPPTGGATNYTPSPPLARATPGERAPYTSPASYRRQGDDVRRPDDGFGASQGRHKAMQSRVHSSEDVYSPRSDMRLSLENILHTEPYGGELGLPPGHSALRRSSDSLGMSYDDLRTPDLSLRSTEPFSPSSSHPPTLSRRVSSESDTDSILSLRHAMKQRRPSVGCAGLLE